MTDFGDSEPEDGWHPDDSVLEQLDNIRRRIRLLRDSVGAVATQREQLRFRDIDVDLAFIIQRLMAD